MKKNQMPMHSYSQLIKQYPDCPEYVSFELLDENQAKINHGQTLQRLAERGGLYPTEMIAVIAKRHFIPKQDVGMAIQSINKHIELKDTNQPPHPANNDYVVTSLSNEQMALKLLSNGYCDQYIRGYLDSRDCAVKVIQVEINKLKVSSDPAKCFIGVKILESLLEKLKS